MIMKISQSLLTVAACLLMPCAARANMSDATILAVNAALDAYESSPILVMASADAPSSSTTAAAENTAPAAAPVALEAATPAPAEEGTKTILGELFKEYNINPSGSVTLDYYNRYVWRGQYLDRDGVFQPGISLTAQNFTVGYWSNWDMRNTDALHSNESDYFVSYAYPMDNVTLTGGYTWYSFPGSGTSSKEYFISAGISTALSPVFTFAHDYEDGKDLGQGDGNYYSLGLSHSIDIEKQYGISLTLGTTLGYIDHQWINGRGWHFTPTAALNIPVTKSMTIAPTIGYNVPGGDLKDPNIGNQEKHVFGGVHTVINF